MEIVEFLHDLAKFIISRKRYWLIPVILFLFLVGTLIIISNNSVLAPFVYTLF